MAIKGRFYFKLTDSGNLLGEYSHWAINESRPESALRTSPSASAGFVGSYVTCWYEPKDGTAVFAKLTIGNRAPAIFTVIWEIAGQRKFEGEGMLCGGVLMGDYHDV
jgi:hypothetical protein